MHMLIYICIFSGFACHGGNWKQVSLPFWVSCASWWAMILVQLFYVSSSSSRWFRCWILMELPGAPETTPETAPRKDDENHCDDAACSLSIWQMVIWCNLAIHLNRSLNLFHVERIIMSRWKDFHWSFIHFVHLISFNRGSCIVSPGAILAPTWAVWTWTDAMEMPIQESMKVHGGAKRHFEVWDNLGLGQNLGAPQCFRWDNTRYIWYNMISYDVRWV